MGGYGVRAQPDSGLCHALAMRCSPESTWLAARDTFGHGARPRPVALFRVLPRLAKLGEGEDVASLLLAVWKAPRGAELA